MKKKIYIAAIVLFALIFLVSAYFLISYFVQINRAQKAYDALADLKEELLTLNGPIYLVGDGSTLTYNTLKDSIEELILPPEHRMHQRATGVALLAVRQAQQGISPDGADLTPNYLRLSQAEREKLERENKR